MSMTYEELMRLVAGQITPYDMEQMRAGGGGASDIYSQREAYLTGQLGQFQGVDPTQAYFDLTNNAQGIKEYNVPDDVLAWNKYFTGTQQDLSKDLYGVQSDRAQNAIAQEQLGMDRRNQEAEFGNADNDVDTIMAIGGDTADDIAGIMDLGDPQKVQQSLLAMAHTLGAVNYGPNGEPLDADGLAIDIEKNPTGWMSPALQQRLFAAIGAADERRQTAGVMQEGQQEAERWAGLSQENRAKEIYLRQRAANQGEAAPRVTQSGAVDAGQGMVGPWQPPLRQPPRGGGGSSGGGGRERQAPERGWVDKTFNSLDTAKGVGRWLDKTARGMFSDRGEPEAQRNLAQANAMRVKDKAKAKPNVATPSLNANRRKQTTARRR